MALALALEFFYLEGGPPLRGAKNSNAKANANAKLKLNFVRIAEGGKQIDVLREVSFVWACMQWKTKLRKISLMFSKMFENNSTF